MSDILSAIQNFIIVVFVTVTTFISAISPLDKPQPTPTPPAQIQQETQEQGAATQSSNVLGTIEDSDKKEKVQPKPSNISPAPTPNPVQTPATTQIYTTPPPFYQAPPLQKETVIIIQPVTPTPTPIIVPDNSWKIQLCKDTIAMYEERKQGAVNTAIVNAQKECSARGYPPPDYIGCETLIQARANEAAGDWDSVITSYKIQSGCWMLVD